MIRQIAWVWNWSALVGQPTLPRGKGVCVPIAESLDVSCSAAAQVCSSVRVEGKIRLWSGETCLAHTMGGLQSPSIIPWSTAPEDPHPAAPSHLSGQHERFRLWGSCSNLVCPFSLFFLFYFLSFFFFYFLTMTDIFKTGGTSKYCQNKGRFWLQLVIWHYLFRNVWTNNSNVRCSSSGRVKKYD